jgi:hypothetical protein
MLPEALPHARLEDREIPLGMQPPAVDDADAPTVMVTLVDEPLHSSRRLPRRLFRLLRSISLVFRRMTVDFDD